MEGLRFTRVFARVPSLWRCTIQIPKDTETIKLTYIYFLKKIIHSQIRTTLNSLNKQSSVIQHYIAKSSHDMPMQAQRGRRRRTCNSNPFAPSALDGDGWSAPRSGRFPPRKHPVHIVQEARWVPGRSGRARKISLPPGFVPRTVPPV